MTSSSLTPAEFTPAQLDVLDQLGMPRAERPVFSNNLKVELKAELEAELGSLAAVIPDDEQLFVSKRHLSQITKCEQNYLADLEAPFSWSLPVARGTLTHKAIELSVYWGYEPTPRELVEQVVAKQEAGDSNLADWVQGLNQVEMAELKSEITERVTTFLECWPPLKREWRPALESATRVELAQGKIVLSGKVDIAVGRAEGNTAGKVIVDLKTGHPSATHQDDLRFYALLDAVKIGTPPRRLASYYLDQARFVPEDVSVALLETTVLRVVDGVRRIAQLRYPDANGELARPERNPSFVCNWCPIQDTCEEGQAHLAAANELI